MSYTATATTITPRRKSTAQGGRTPPLCKTSLGAHQSHQDTRPGMPLEASRHGQRPSIALPPRTWGSTVVPTPVSVVQSVVPTRVGVNRGRSWSRSVSSGCPHARGGEP